jgi:hypothetical protein
MALMMAIWIGLGVYLTFLATRALARAYDRGGVTVAVIRFATYVFFSCSLLMIHTIARFGDMETVQSHLFGYSPGSLPLLGPFALANIILLDGGRLRCRPTPRAWLSMVALFLASFLTVLTMMRGHI